MRPIDAEPLEEILRLRCMQCSGDYGSISGAVSGCLKLVQAQPTITQASNDPLTLDELREMDGEKKEPTLEEQAEMTKEAVHKIMDILNELPPTCHIVASMMLRMALSGPVSSMTGMLMMGGMFSPSELFRFTEKPMGWPTGMGPRGRFG